ncbi:MAG: hypothetical protein HGB10_09795 [Coriobacteriia bacterium]|nr:hypothetical protein [Coriobacteriia bacterium]
MTDGGVFNRSCPYCGASETRRLGDCTVCHRVVCEKCGNVQMTRGERRVTHNSCLKKADGGFKMIKFVD